MSDLLPSDAEVARCLVGRILPNGKGVEFAGPGRPRHERACCYRADPNAPDGFVVTDAKKKIEPLVLKDWVRSEIGLPFVPRHKNEKLHNHQEVRSEPQGHSRKGEGGASTLRLPSLVGFDADALLESPAPERRFQVAQLIPAGDVGMLGGDGGEGKTNLGLQLGYLTPRGLPWIGHETRPGSAIYLSAEEPIDELHYRIEKIAKAVAYEGKPPHSLTLISRADTDATLATFADGAVRPTTLFQELTDVVSEKGARLLVLDACADVFGGNEIDRSHVRAFIRLLRSLAIANDCAVLLLSHPSVDGMRTGRGYSGSTHWNNAVRSRLYLTKAEANGSEADPDLRELTLAKANRGPRGQKTLLRWRDGYFVVEHGAGAPDNLALLQAKNTFLDLLRQLNQQGRRVSPNRSPTYAPRVFSVHPSGKGITLNLFVHAMDHLFGEKQLLVRSEGPPSRRREYIVEVPRT
jgi:hypothetical protein